MIAQDAINLRDLARREAFSIEYIPNRQELDNTDWEFVIANYNLGQDSKMEMPEEAEVDL